MPLPHLIAKFIDVAKSVIFAWTIQNEFFLLYIFRDPISNLVNELLDYSFNHFFMNSVAERLNFLIAMFVIVTALGAYATTGQLIPVFLMDS